MKYNEIIKELKSLSDPEAVKGMARFGITPSQAFGISIPNLRRFSKQVGKNHDLACRLWEKGYRETRILASMIDDPQIITEAQMDTWVKDFYDWEVCDQCCMNLFKKTPFAYKKCYEWSASEEEFVKRAGFVMMACLAVSDKEAPDEKFVEFLPVIEKVRLMKEIL